MAPKTRQHQLLRHSRRSKTIAFRVLTLVSSILFITPAIALPDETKKEDSKPQVKAETPAADTQKSTQSLQQELRKLQQRLAEIEQRVQKQEELEEKRKQDDDGNLANKDDWKIRWAGTLIIENKKRNLKFTFGGRIHAEATFFEEDRGIRHSAIGRQDDGFQIRRTRILLTGEIGKHIEFQTQYDFAGGDTDFRNIFIGYKNLPYIGRIRVGQMKEPFSLVQSENTNNTPFIERASTASLSRIRNTGILLQNHWKKRIQWSVGVFRFSDDFGNSENQGPGDYNFTGRITGTPWYAEDGKYLIHLGAGYSYRKPVNDTMRFRSRPRNALASRFVDTGNFVADDSQLFGVEFATVLKSFSVQSEFVYSWVARPRGAREHFKSWYVQAMWFVTGEHRNYKGGGGTFGATKIIEPFDLSKRQYGAFEIGVRYSFIDLNSGPIRGGQMADFTVGANWYLFQGVRIMFDYIHANRYGIGDADIFYTRFQIAW